MCPLSILAIKKLRFSCWNVRETGNELKDLSKTDDVTWRQPFADALVLVISFGFSCWFFGLKMSIDSELTDLTDSKESTIQANILHTLKNWNQQKQFRVIHILRSEGYFTSPWNKYISKYICLHSSLFQSKSSMVHSGFPARPTPSPLPLTEWIRFPFHKMGASHLTNNSWILLENSDCTAIFQIQVVRSTFRCTPFFPLGTCLLRYTLQTNIKVISAFLKKKKNGQRIEEMPRVILVPFGKTLTIIQRSSQPVVRGEKRRRSERRPIT